MNSETRTCQNCHQEFAIESDDFKFYEKIKVPPPTWCPECRFQRQYSFRNERTLYKRKCDAPGHLEELISIYHPSSAVIVYDQKYWWSDEWDAREYGKGYDFAQPFFMQWDNLLQKIPWPHLINRNSVNSEYCNSVYDLKNCYLSFAADNSEDCLYGTDFDFCKNCVDFYYAWQDEKCYEVVFSDRCYNSSFIYFSENCLDSMFLIDCRGCSNCFGCVGLRNKSYFIFNKPYSKEDYLRELSKFNLGGSMSQDKIFNQFNDLRLKYPMRYARIYQYINSTGDNLKHTKNCKNCFDSLGTTVEDSKDLFVPFGAPSKDCYSVFTVGGGEMCYDSASINACKNIFFSKKIWTGHDIYYSLNCHNSSNLFACIGLRSKSYCILNKQYTKEEYEKMVPRIIEHMNNMPYIDKKGRVYKYGEFFPPELSPFSYNETIAQEYFPLNKEEAIEKGYSWKDPEPRNYQIQIPNDKLPDHIKDVQDDIVNKVIECQHQGKCNEQCTEAYKIIEPELQFLRRMNLPLPRLCPNCRHYQRIKQRNPLRLWPRKCQCQGKQGQNSNNSNTYQNTATHPSHNQDQTCPNEFQTSYAPERPEIVYCEQCYQSEVV